MKPPTPLKTQVKVAAKAGGLVATTLGLLAPFSAERAILKTLADGEARAEVSRQRWVRRWSRSLLRLFGVHDTCIGGLPHNHRGALVVANHRSAADIGLLLAHTGGALVSRADLAGWPVIGLAARSVGTLFVDRGDVHSGVETIRRIAARLQGGGVVCLFPEGTTFVGDDVRPFHAGAFLAAKQAGVPIIPAGIAYETGSELAFVGETFPAHVKRVAAGKGARVVLALGAPIEAKGPAAKLALQAHDAVADLVKLARERVDAQPPPTK